MTHFKYLKLLTPLLDSSALENLENEDMYKGELIKGSLLLPPTPQITVFEMWWIAS